MSDTGASTAATAAAITAVWRRESTRLVAALTRITRDVGLAEDLVQDALVAALDQWPGEGVPTNPAAWLMTAAKRRAVDHFRRADTLRRHTTELAHEEVITVNFDAHVDHIEDDVLRLIFLCCHPALTPDSRAALTLRLVGGLTTAEIARGFMVSEASMGQRISRAKATLTKVDADFELPTGGDRLHRLDDVLAVIYLVFNEGYSATAGEDWTRPDLCHEAIRLARILSGLVPDEPEVHSLLALVELQASRLHARVDATGQPVLLDHQDRQRWDRLLIRRGQAALAKAEKLAAAGEPVGRYYLQAAIAELHARALRPEETDWTAIAGWYDVLATAAPGPVIEVNRAVAHGRAFGPLAGLAILERIPEGILEPQLIPATRGDLLMRLEKYQESADAFRAAAEMCRNNGARVLLNARAAAAETHLDPTTVGD